MGKASNPPTPFAKGGYGLTAKADSDFRFVILIGSSLDLIFLSINS